MSDAAGDLGFVVIGRNEGERLRRCLASLPPGRLSVYVDSGSTDGSVALARAMGANVIELPATRPFTAAWARNEGAKWLLERPSPPRLLHFIDGDCELLSAWIEPALSALAERDRLAVVCGRRRERHPEASMYNRLCDMEWNTPVGEAASCGGDSIMRAEAFTEVGGFSDDLIAGEEPELCRRLRGFGWSIARLPHDMTIHDAAMTTFRQWWKRTVRSGHAYAEGASRDAHASMMPHRQVQSIAWWGGILPLFALALAWWTWGVSIIAAFLAYVVLWIRVRAWQARHDPSSHAALYATFCVLGKFAQFMGMMTFVINRLRRTPSRLIEYKSAEASAPKAPPVMERLAP